MKLVPVLLVSLFLFGCSLEQPAPQPTLVDIRAQEQAAEERQRALQFLAKTPFEVCKANPELVKRYGGMKDCKQGIRDEQKRVQDALAAEDTDLQMRRNLILQYMLPKVAP